MAKKTETPNPYKIAKFIDNERGVRAAVVNATEAVREMQKIQKTYPISTMMVGRSMVAAALLASQLKDGDVVSLYFRGDGPIEMVFAEADYEGGVRGYTPQPQVMRPLVNGQLDLAGAIGRGFLNVVRSNPQGQAPYRGTVEIQSGEIGDDVAYYLQQSEQTRSVVALGVKVNAFGQVLSAGGLIIELLPNAPDLIGDLIAERVREAGSISEAIEQGATNFDVVKMYLDGFDLLELEHPHSIVYSCRCTRSRLKRSLELLPVEDLDQIVSKKETVNAKCEFCGKEYNLTHVEAQKIRDKKYRDSLN